MHESIGKLVKMQPLTQQVWPKAWENAFLTCSQVLPLLLVQGPDFK